jgi:DNA-binding response OmpR family regulator
MNDDQNQKSVLQDEEIIEGLKQSDRYYEATSRVIDVPALIEEVRKRLGKDPKHKE